MGRRERRKITGVSEEKEQKKIRDNILKVLKARTSSPGQGGALLVAEPITSDRQKNKNARRKRQLISVSTGTDESSSGSFRSMSGRGRKRTKSVSLSRRRSRKSTKEKKEVEKDTAVSKHLRVAHGITGQQVNMKNEVQCRSNRPLYTNARITQKVGLISTGRKGAPASRGIVVPDHISKQTEEDIRKMSAEAEADVYLTGGDIDVAERLVFGSGDSYSRRMQTPASVDMRPALSQCKDIPLLLCKDMDAFDSNSVESLRNRPSPYGVDCGKFPERLPVKETVANLMVPLKFLTKSLFPERDYLRETQDELLKLVKQNAPRTATPTRLAVFHNITKTGSVQRSLVESFTSEDSDHRASCDNGRTLEEVVENGSRNNGKANAKHDENEHITPYNDHMSLVPKINFADSNPFQITNVNKEMFHLRKRNLPQTGLSSLKRTRELNLKNADYNNNFHEGANEKAKESESLHSLYNNARLLEYSRKKLQNEIRAFNESHKHDGSREMENGGLEVKDHLSDANDLTARKKFEEEDYFFYGNGKVFRTPKSPVLESRKKLVMPGSQVFNWDLLQTNDENSESTGNREKFEPMEIDAKEAEAVNLLEQNDFLKEQAEQQRYDVERSRYPTDNNRTVEWVDRHSRSRSQCSHCSQGSSDHSSQLQVPTREPNYMPSFHGNYYTDHMGTGDLSWQQKSHRVKVEAMDILDYVDQCIGRDSYVDCRGDRTATLSAVSPDLDTSPRWRAAGHILHRRALLPTSPKSPDGPKFYPKKMY